MKASNPADLSKSKTLELLVDSDAIFTSISRKTLEEIEPKPVARRKLRVYGGALVKRDIGGVMIEYGDSKAVVPVVFGEHADTQILGATALGSLGISGRSGN